MPALNRVVYLAWIIYLSFFLVNHLRIRRQPHRQNPEHRVRRDRLSDWGILLQGLAVLAAFAIRIDPPRTGAAAIIGLLLIASAWTLTANALYHLGRQWRLQAVMTDDHELVTTGPYRFLRHPIYTGFLTMVLGTAMVVTAGWAGVAAVGLFVAGTEVRIRSEDALLAAHFPDTFPAYRASAPAYLPFIR